MIRLPWPSPCMWPNSRVDRRSSAGTRRKYREAGAWATKAAGWRALNWQSAHLRITFCPPDRRARDLDNMLAAIKSGLDGVSDVIGVDDSKWDMTIRRGDVVKGGEVRIEFVELCDERVTVFEGQK